jgi:hypothetical protein
MTRQDGRAEQTLRRFSEKVDGNLRHCDFTSRRSFRPTHNDLVQQPREAKPFTRQLPDPANAHQFVEHEHFRGKIVFAIREQNG